MNRQRYLSPTARRGLDRLGDALLPGEDRLPSFSTLQCADHADFVLEEMPADDRSSLLVLLALCRFVPMPVLRWLVSFLERRGDAPEPLGTAFRFLRMGIKGFVFTLYYSGEKGQGYSGPSPLEAIGYEVSVYTDDVEGRAPPGGDAVRGTTGQAERLSQPMKHLP